MIRNIFYVVKKIKICKYLLTLGYIFVNITLASHEEGD